MLAIQQVEDVKPLAYYQEGIVERISSYAWLGLVDAANRLRKAAIVLRSRGTHHTAANNTSANASRQTLNALGSGLPTLSGAHAPPASPQY